ncbi:MAG: CDGSH iron-sulfur domain-containing protein [Candidatus Pacearchaeota archaeon]|nr:CDGSH iron-sulfur domain-containing protein [Candidatus Pacearchaeota archaeon]
MSQEEKKIKITKDGPYLVSGNVPLSKEIMIIDKNKFPYKWEKTTKFPNQENYALCRCGKSKNKPFCDSSHLEGFDGTETAGEKTYLQQAETTSGPTLELTDVSDLCASAKFCDRDKGTWGLTRNSNNKKSKEMAIEQACNCPSGRLVAWENGKPIEPNFEKEISLVEDTCEKVSGPLWIKGKIPIESSQGKKYETRNRVTLCRCGKSKTKPFCDGSHITSNFNDGDKSIN